MAHLNMAAIPFSLLGAFFTATSMIGFIAGAVRFRPMTPTAAVAMVCSAVILFDSIFQSLAIA